MPGEVGYLAIDFGVYYLTAAQSSCSFGGAPAGPVYVSSVRNLGAVARQCRVRRTALGIQDQDIVLLDNEMPGFSAILEMKNGRDPGTFCDNAD